MTVAQFREEARRHVEAALAQPPGPLRDVRLAALRAVLAGVEGQPPDRLVLVAYGGGRLEVSVFTRRVPPRDPRRN